MDKKVMPFNHYGESLDSTPGFFSLKRQYEEDLFMEELNNSQIFCKFDTPKNELEVQENKHVSLIKETERIIYVKEQVPKSKKVFL